MKKSSTRAILTAAILALAFGGRTSAEQVVANPHAGYCNKTSEVAFKSWTDEQHGCFSSGLGWVYYKFSDEFQALTPDKRKEIIKHLFVGPGTSTGNLTDESMVGGGNGGWWSVAGLSDCFSSAPSRKNPDGFYRFGMIQYKTSSSFEASDSNSDGWKSFSTLVSGDVAGAMLTGNQPRTATNGSWSTDRQDGSGNLATTHLSQEIRISGTDTVNNATYNKFLVATAVSFTDAINDEAAGGIKSEYDEMLNETGLSNHWEQDGDGKAVMSFCGYGSGIGEQDAYFKGSVAINIGGTSVVTSSDPDANPIPSGSKEYPTNVSNQTITLTYTSQPAGSTAKPKYSVSYTVEKRNADGSWTQVGTDSKNDITASNTTTFSSTTSGSPLNITLNYGEEYKICAYNSYHSKATYQNINYPVYGSVQKVSACATITRPLLTSELHSMAFAKIDGTQYNSSQDGTGSIDANPSTATIDPILVEPGTSHTVELWNNLTRTNAVFDTTFNTTYNGATSSVTMANHVGSYDFTHQNETVTLQPQEERDYSTELTHPAQVNNRPESIGSRTSKLSFKIRGKDFECNSDFGSYKKFGVKDGYNMSIVKVTNGRQTVGTTNYAYDGDDSNTVSVWARPNDTIQFTHLVCAGATYTAYKKNDTATEGKTKYIASAASDLNTGNFLYGSSFTAANTQNLVTDPIGNFLNSDKEKSPRYTLSVNSPSSSSTAVTVNDLGSTISQKMTWSNIAYVGGNLERNGGSDKEATAEVKIPYNYVLKPSVSIGGSEDEHVMPGMNLNISGSLNVDGRQNKDIKTSDGILLGAYATNTRATETRLIVFSSENGMTSSGVKYVSGDAGLSDGTLCSEAAGSVNCSSHYRLSTESGEVYGGGDHSSLISGTHTVALDGMKVGTHICAITASYPADSHAAPTANFPDNAPALGSNIPSGSYWAVSAPACVTVAKKPTVSVEGGDLFVKGDIIASHTKRGPNPDENYFGSWAEYGVISTGSIYGFSSGAATAYAAGGSLVSINESRTAAGMSNAKSPAEEGETRCLYNTQTFANLNCIETGDGAIGNVDGTAIASKVSAYARDVIARFTPTDKTNNDPFTGNISGCTLDDGSYVNGDGNNNYSCRTDGIATFYRDGDTTLNGISSLSMPRADNKTLVIFIDGTLTLNGDIKISNGSYSSVMDVPNVVVIARNIKISQSVSTIDAWLISGYNDAAAEDGEIDTCYEYAADSLNSERCAKSLIVNGMTLAKKLSLKRTAGAGTDENSQSFGANHYIKRAEIFNLPATNYYWGYGSASKSNAMRTNYMREIPSRY